MKFNRDWLTNADLKEVSRASFAIIDALQSYSPGAKAAALAAVFQLFMNSAGLRPSDALEVVNNVMHEGEGKRPEFRAIAAYFQHEMD